MGYCLGAAFIAQIAQLGSLLERSKVALGDTTMTHTILRLPAIKMSTGLSRSTVYLRITQGLLTRPVSLGGRAVGWPATEIETLNAARIAGKSDMEVRLLVRQLEASRKLAR